MNVLTTLRTRLSSGETTTYASSDKPQRRTGRLRAAVVVLLVAALFAVSILPHISTAKAASVSPVTGLSVLSLPSSLRVSWTATNAPNGYKVTLIRQRDQAIMEQFTTTATITDVQPIYPNETYKVAVQVLDQSGNPGPATLSSVVQMDNTTIAGLNGFLDQMNLPAGSMDSNLWDFRSYFPGVSTSASFINPQLHGHLETGQIAYEQSIISMTPRVPVNFTNRTAHIHGEVDLHGDLSSWFSINLSPVMISAQETIDDGDRAYSPRTLPMLTIVNAQPGMYHNHSDITDIRLGEAVGNGNGPTYVVNDMIPDFALSNVRNVVDYYVSTNHVKFVVDGHTLADVNLPQPLPFSVGYLSLVAEAYPKIAQDMEGHVPACDQPGGACNIWHLDNWGFDAPAGQVQPATTVNYSDGCTPAPSVPEQTTVDQACGKQVLNTPSDIATYNVNVADISHTSSVQVLAQQYSYDLTAMQHIQVNVNGNGWTPLVFPEPSLLYSELGSVTIPVSQFHSGGNTLQFRTTQVTNGNSGMYLANVVVQQVRTTAYVPPALPAEAASLGQWQGSGSTPSVKPTIKSLTPTSGAPGTVVTITGSGFTGTTAVNFTGNVAGTNLTIDSDTMLEVSVPNGAKSGPITVVTPNGSVTSSASFSVPLTIAINNVKCTVTLPNGGVQTGTCSGTFTPTQAVAGTSLANSSLVGNFSSSILNIMKWGGLVLVVIAACVGILRIVSGIYATGAKIGSLTSQGFGRHEAINTVVTSSARERLFKTFKK